MAVALSMISPAAGSATGPTQLSPRTIRADGTDQNAGAPAAKVPVRRLPALSHARSRRLVRSTPPTPTLRPDRPGHRRTRRRSAGQSLLRSGQSLCRAGQSPDGIRTKDRNAGPAAAVAGHPEVRAGRQHEPGSPFFRSRTGKAPSGQRAPPSALLQLSLHVMSIMHSTSILVKTSSPPARGNQAKGPADAETHFEPVEALSGSHRPGARHSWAPIREKWSAHCRKHTHRVIPSLPREPGFFAASCRIAAAPGSLATFGMTSMRSTRPCVNPFDAK